MDQAGGIVERFPENRQAGMLRFMEQGEQFGQADAFIRCHDLGAGHHHVADRELAEFEQIAHHHPLLRRQGRGFPLAFLDHLFQALADGSGVGIAAGDLPEQTHQRVIAHVRIMA